MLLKSARVTVIPAVAGVAAVPASHDCAVSPPYDGSTGLPPPSEPDPAGAYVPDAGTPIVLEDGNGDGTYTVTTSIAPAPDGFVCRLETEFISVPGSTDPAVQYNVVCTRG